MTNWWTLSFRTIRLLAGGKKIQRYSVAEQFKNHGRIIQSTAPIPEQITEMVQPRTSVVAPPPLPSWERGKLP